ncbi:MAG: rhodanese-like domain-containing protein [Bacteroidota bacterium]
MTYHVFLYFLYQDTVEQISPVPELADNYLILDTREQHEFVVSHIKNAVWVGYSDFNLDQTLHFPKDTAILVYCSVGYRSEKIGEQLLKVGFSNVHNIYGGIFNWKNKGFPVYRNGMETDSLHVYGKGWGFFLREGKRVL